MVLERHGVGICERTRIAAVEQGAAITADGDRIAFDLCLWNGGFVANPLARQAGLPVNARGQVRVDATLRVPEHSEVFVAGDAAEASGPDGEPLAWPAPPRCRWEPTSARRLRRSSKGASR